MTPSPATTLLATLGLWLASAGPTLGAPVPAAPPADPKVAWLRDNAVALRSISPTDDDFSDLQPLRQVLDKARVVVLGEATHGDGSTFLAKTRLVRFLHRELGYDVLAFESGFYDCWKAWQRIRTGEDPGAAFRQSVFPIWAASAQVQPLIDHFASAARSPRPLELAGIDPQFTGELSQRFFLEDLTRIVEAAGMSRELLVERLAGPLTNLLEARYESGELPEPAARSALLAWLAELESRLRAGAGEALPERAFWIRLLEGLRQLAVSSWVIDWSRPLLEDVEHYPVRDRVMGEHLVWLARERFPGRKIIVWTHSGHAARGLAGVDVPSPVHARLYRTFQPAGAVARAKLGNELYTVAVLAYQGEYARELRKGLAEALLRPSEGSLEDLFHRTGLAQAFLDLGRAHRLPRWLRGRLIARPIGYKEMRASWREVFDGILFLERMDRSDRVTGSR